MEGLNPGAKYTFSVTAENAVSSQDSDVTARTANIFITTEEGGKTLEVSLEKLGATHPTFMSNSSHCYNNYYQLQGQCQISLIQTVAVQW